jgi:hypothetical protein
MRDPGLELLGHLLDASHDLAPDEIVPTVTRAGRAVNAEDVAIYLVDYDQTLLVPLADGTDRTPLEIDATLAGRAYSAITAPSQVLPLAKRCNTGRVIRPMNWRSRSRAGRGPRPEPRRG